MTAPTRPVLRWHGGKWRLAPWILDHMPSHRVYVEPFGGAGSVLLRKPRAYAEVYNDLDDEVVGLFDVLREPESAKRLEELLRLTPFARSEFKRAYRKTEEPIERARRLIIRAFMGFGSNAHSSQEKGHRSTGFRANANKNGTTATYCLAIARRHGVAPNPLYGWGLKRVGCFPCINCAKAELALVDSHFPEQIDRLEEWERLVSDASKRGHMSFFTLVNDPVMAAEWEIFKAAGGKAVLSPADGQFGVRRMVEWAKTDRGGRQYSLFARDVSTVCHQWGACE